MPRSIPAVVTTLSALFVLTGCSPATTQPASDQGLQVVTSFYPLEFLVAEIGGASVEVVNLTQPGAEPHDLELTPKDVAALVDADEVIYLSNFQPAVDDAVATRGEQSSFDVAPAANLSRNHSAVDGDSDSSELVDPHFWLDPQRYAAVAEAIAARLSAIDQARAEVYAANAASLTQRLATTDQAWAEATAECESRDLVTSHSSFGYLADRYGFTQVGVAGLSPENEPSPQQLADISRFVSSRDVRTIYFEPLSSSAVAETVARETGAETAVLDPLEGITEASAGDNYFTVMEANLAAVRNGQGCR